MSIHFHKLAVKDVRKETATAISVSFEVPTSLKPVFEFQAGQNITIRTFINDIEIRRSYSICSSPHENELRIAVKEVTGGLFSSWASRELLKGHVLDVLPPTGRFSLRPDPQNKKRYLAIAAGSGITPVLSIITAALNIEPNSAVTLLYGNRNRASIMFRNQLHALKNKFMPRFALHHVLSSEITDAEIYSGRITDLKCEEFSGELIDFLSMDEIFLCGPEAMIFSIRDWLLAIQVPANKIHYELFTTPIQAGNSISAVNISTVAQHLEMENEGLLAVESKMTSDVTVKLDGTQFDFKLGYEAESILEAALKHGVDLPFSCKGGVCSTCRARLTEGEIKMDLNYALEAEEIDAGFILCCQSHPRSEKVVIDFDNK